MKQQETDIRETYYKLLRQQKFEKEELDYSILERHKPNLQKIAEIGHSTISIFDLFQTRHVFHSFNIGEMLGYNVRQTQSTDEDFWDSKIHPLDYIQLMKNGVTLLKLFQNIPASEKSHYKLISEFRILNANNNYIRVIEQQQALEITTSGSIWLALSILDISPNQKNINEACSCELLNFKMGHTVPIPFSYEENTTVMLTQREIEILKLVRKGFLSKEISSKLSISVNTVNTHRQRVLEKLGVNNSMEAVNLALKLGII